MMNFLLFGMIVFSFITSIFTKKVDVLSAAALTGGTQALELTLKMGGMICLWSGMMNVAEKSGMTEKLSKVLRPVTGALFKSISPDSAAMGYISMNIAANLLGLGNAATPLGIAAMLEMKKACPGETASDDMITFVVMNTASLQLIPTTAAFIRQEAGSAAPMDIIVPVWFTSVVVLIVGVTVAKLLSMRRERAEKPIKRRLTASSQ